MNSPETTYIPPSEKECPRCTQPLGTNILGCQECRRVSGATPEQVARLEEIQKAKAERLGLSLFKRTRKRRG